MRADFPAVGVAKAYLVVVLGLSILAGLLFPVWAWGLSLVGEYPWPVSIFFIVFSLIGLLPPFSRRIRSFFERLSKPGTPDFRSIHIVIFSLLAAIIPLAFIVSCPLMGDGVGIVYRSYPYLDLEHSIHRHFPFLTAVIFDLHNILQFFIAVPINLAAGDRSYFVWSVIGSVSAFVFTFSLVKIFLLLRERYSSALLLLLAVLTSGTMALFTGFVEVNVICAALLCVFLWMVLRALEKGKFPWIIFSLFFLYLGLHASAVALVPSLVYLIIVQREELAKKPVILVLNLVIPAAVFIFLISRLVDPAVYFSQFISDKEVIDSDFGAAYAFGLFSPMHVLELANVLLLHNPLNLLFLAWILYALVFEWREWIRDRAGVFLLLLLGSFGAILWLFNAVLGVMRDWDIYTPLGLLLPFAAWRLWEVSAPKSMRPRLAGIVALLLPLAACHLALWVFTLHSPERLIVRMFEYAKENRIMSERGKEDLASNISIYCMERDYFPDSVLNIIGADPDIRRFMVYRITDRDDKTDFFLGLAQKWEDRLSPQECAQIGGILLDKKKYDEGLYYLRLSTNRMETDDKILIEAASYLINYYIDKELSAAVLFYLSRIPDKEIEKINPGYYQAIQMFRNDGSLPESMDLINKLAPEQIFNNGLSLFEAGSLKSAEQELIAARRMGIDSLRVNPILAKIRRFKGVR
ncbi:MAG TPA: hypothetical protein VM123_03935 [archaeon]|nr:hypothetical protein [archaeon]